MPLPLGLSVFFHLFLGFLFSPRFVFRLSSFYQFVVFICNFSLFRFFSFVALSFVFWPFIFVLLLLLSFGLFFFSGIFLPSHSLSSCLFFRFRVLPAVLAFFFIISFVDPTPPCCLSAFMLVSIYSARL